MGRIVIFLFVVTFIHCNTNTSPSRASVETWVDRVCCENNRSLFIRKVKVTKDKIGIDFCDVRTGSVVLSLTCLDDLSGRELFDIHMDSIEEYLQVGMGNVQIGIKGYFGFKEPLKDGEYSLYISKGECGEYFFYLKDGVVFNERFHCIKQCQLAPAGTDQLAPTMPNK